MTTRAQEGRIWEEALQEARIELEPEIREIVHSRAWRIRNERIADLRRAERKAAAVKAREDEERELARNALKAWRKLFGRRLAADLGLRTSYWLLRDRGEAWVFTDRRAQWAAYELIEAYDPEARAVAKPDPIEGIALGTAVGSDRLLAVDPPISIFEDRVHEADRRRLEIRKAEAKAQGERRRKRRDVAIFGVELDGPE